MVIAGFLGLVMVHHPMLFSGLARIQSDPGDPRLINYLLEHSYLWISGNPAHRQFWDIPFFYPAPTWPHSRTRSDRRPVVLGLASRGVLARHGLPALDVTTSALNYLAGYWLLRSGFRRGVVGSISWRVPLRVRGPSGQPDGASAAPRPDLYRHHAHGSTPHLLGCLPAPG